MMSVVFLAGPLSGLVSQPKPSVGWALTCLALSQLAQPIVGVFSDACKSTLGRRRPYMIAGCAVAATSMMMLGWSKSLAAIFVSRESSAHTTVTLAFAVFAIYALDFSINVVQAVDRSLLVDVVPPHLQADANAWASRMFGVGAVSGYWVGGLDLVYWTRGWLGDEQLKVLTLITTSLLIVCHLVTILCVRERVLISSTNGTNGRSSGSTWRVATLGVWHDIWHMMRNLPRPIRQLFHVQFCNWIGWFPVLFFSSTWVSTHTVWPLSVMRLTVYITGGRDVCQGTFVRHHWREPAEDPARRHSRRQSRHAPALSRLSLRIDHRATHRGAFDTV